MSKIDTETEEILSGEWWEVLGVSKNSDHEDVKLAYRRLARIYHPDTNVSAHAKTNIQTINTAYEYYKKNGFNPS